MDVLLAALVIVAALSPNPSVKSSDGQPACMALHEAHDAMNMRGEHGMGFSQTATTHHFLLTPDGGIIEVNAKSDDAAARDEIHMHLTHISHAFAAGEFDIPMFVHDTVPPGVLDMKRLQSRIHYTFEETAAGGRVVIKTDDAEALAAIHKFLRFQIDEHQTVDPH